jgi:MoaA/NifB/PqqE/SkfB family radical SAM enzyme
LKLLGGEPLLDKRLLTELRSLPEQQKQKLSLYIVTNGSKDLLATKEYLGNFKSIMFTISLEGTSRVQDYARYGSNWSTVSANIVNFKKLFPSDVIIHTTLQTTTILGLKDLAEWAKKYKLSLSMGLCQRPDYLSFLSLPDAVREQVKKSLVEAKIIISQKTVGDEEGWPIEKIINIMEQTQFDPTQYKKFLDYIIWYENGKNIPNLKDIFPLLFIDKYQ